MILTTNIELRTMRINFVVTTSHVSQHPILKVRTSLCFYEMALASSYLPAHQFEFIAMFSAIPPCPFAVCCCMARVITRHRAAFISYLHRPIYLVLLPPYRLLIYRVVMASMEANNLQTDTDSHRSRELHHDNESRGVCLIRK